MKVSVIVPIYKVESYIGKCARSLFEQTFSDIEYIFVNDCTPDASESVLLDVMEDYPDRKNKVKIIGHEHNMGLPAARKTGLDAASGEYVYFCDSDDWIEKDAMEKCIGIAEAESADMVCFGFRYENKGQSSESGCILPENDLGTEGNLRCLLRGRNSLVSICGKFLRRSLFSDNDISFAKYNMMEDLVMSVQLFYYAEKVCYLDECLYHYNTNNTNSICYTTYSTPSSDLYGKCVGAFGNLLFAERFLKSKKLRKLYREWYSLMYRTKRTLLYPQLPSPRFQWLFIKTFPELFFTVITDKTISLSDRIKYYLTLAGIWPGLYKLALKIKNRI